MNIINMTPHTLNIRQADGSFRDVPAPTKAEIEANPNLIARCAVTRTLVDVRDGIEIFESVFGAPSPLPDSHRTRSSWCLRFTWLACGRTGRIARTCLCPASRCGMRLAMSPAATD